MDEDYSSHTESVPIRITGVYYYRRDGVAGWVVKRNDLLPHIIRLARASMDA